MNNIVNDISCLTTAKKSDIQHVFKVMEDCICNEVLECIKSQALPCNIDVGIGTLLVDVQSNELRYKFIPSTGFEEKLSKTILDNKSPVVENLESMISSKFMTLYKELYQ